MLNKAISRRSLLGLGAAAAASTMLPGCSGGRSDGKVEVEVVRYKQEAVSIFEKLAEEFNATHDDIYLNFTSPADAVTIMKTRFVREDYPDIIGIGGDADYASFVDSDILADVSDAPTMAEVSEAYQAIDKSVTYVPMDGIYGVPYVANAAGMLYNVDMFEEHGWPIPETWDELIDLCKQIQSEGEVLPFYLGYLDTWTILSPWNSITTNLVPSDLARQVNAGEAKFSDYYRRPAEMMLEMLDYAEEGPFAYSYNDACTAFARGQAAMYPCGSFAVPQIKSVNPDMNVGLFPMPSAENPDDRIVVSGIDLQWCVAKNCDHMDAVYEVISFLSDPANIQTYIDDQNAVPCLDGDFQLSELFDGVAEWIEEGKVLDYLDHTYPSAMACDAQLQTMLLSGDIDAFLSKWDTDWQRYNRSVIRKVQAYEEQQ